MSNTKGDPRVLALAASIAQVIVAVVDIANGGAPLAAPSEDAPAETGGAPSAKSEPATSGSAKAAPAASRAPKASSPKTTAAPSSGGDTRATAKALTVKIHKEQGREVAVELLAKFDAISASSIDEDRLDDFVAAAGRVDAGESVEDAIGDDLG